MKKDQKRKAKQLRKQGFSYKEIAERLKISKSTTSLWLRDIPLKNDARLRIERRGQRARLQSAATRRKQRRRIVEVVYAEKRKEIRRITYSKELCRLQCALLCWCEGSKSDRSARFINSDPKLVATFLLLLRSGFAINETKLRAVLHLHSYHDEKKQKRFWSRITGIPEKQFLKTYQKQNTGKRRKDNYQGCISIRYNDTRVGTEIEAIWKSFGDFMMGA